jgi:hypothetical protein
MNIRLTIFCVILLIIGYYSHDIITPNEKIISDINLKEKITKEPVKKILSEKEKREIKNDFNKTDVNYPTRVIVTKDGSIIERIK